MTPSSVNTLIDALLYMFCGNSGCGSAHSPSRKRKRKRKRKKGWLGNEIRRMAMVSRFLKKKKEKKMSAISDAFIQRPQNRNPKNVSLKSPNLTPLLKKKRKSSRIVALTLHPIENINFDLTFLFAALTSYLFLSFF